MKRAVYLPLLPFLCLLCINFSLRGQTISIEVDGNDLYYSETGCTDCNSSPDPSWRSRMNLNGSNYNWNVDMSNFGACGWKGQTNGAWINPTTVPFANRTLTLSFDGWEGDGFICGADDGVCGGYSVIQTIDPTTYPPCQWNNPPDASRVCNMGYNETYQVRWSHYWYWVTLPPGGSITAGGTQTVCTNGDPGLINASTDTYPYVGYQWQQSTDGGATWTDIPGATGEDYDPPGGITVTTLYRRQLYAIQACNIPPRTSTTNATVTVVPPPSPTASNTGPYCSGGTIVLNSSGGTGYSWAGPLAYSSGAQNPTIPSATPGMSGTYTVTVTNAGGCTATATTTVSVTTGITANASNTGPYCQGGTILLSSSGGTGYSWSGPAGFSSAAQNPSITSAATTMNGTYTVTVSAAGGCTATATTTVTVNSLPVAAAGNTGPFCEGSTLQLSSSGGTGYSWSGPAGFTSLLQNPTAGPATLAMGGTYTVTVTNAGGCTATATTNIVINAAPIPACSNTGPYCDGATIVLNSSGGTGYSWAGPLAYSGSTQNPTLPAATSGMSGTYTVTVTGPGGCTATASTTVVVNNAITLTASANTPLCAGATLNLSATNVAGAQFDWTGPGGYTATNQQNPGIPGSIAANSGMYTVTATDAGGCTGSASVNVTVNALPVAAANNNGPVCEGSALMLGAVGGTTYDWTGPNGYVQTNMQAPVIAPVTPAHAGTYTVTVTDANNCSATATTLVAVNAAPVAVAGSNSPVCEGGSLQLTSGGGTSYAWAGPAGFTSLTQNPVINPATPGASGGYTVTVTDASNCTATATANVLINTSPVIIANASAPQCIGQDVQLSASGAATYSWSGPAGYSSGTQNPVLPAPGSTASGMYTVTGTDANGCSATASVNITLSTPPVAGFTANTTTGCAPLCVSFTDNSTGGATAWNWLSNTQSFSTAQNPNYCFNQPGVYDIALVVASPQGCTDTAVITGYIQAGDTYPTADFTISQQDASGLDPTYTFVNTSSNGQTYLWNFGDGNTSTDMSPVHTYSDTGTYCVVLTVTNADGCTDMYTACVTVHGTDAVYIPNSFTPNEDHLNETWFPVGRDLNTLKLYIEVHVFNRWGERVFRSTSSDKPWNGRVDNTGSKCPEGVYSYRVIYVKDGKEQRWMGHVNLLR